MGIVTSHHFDVTVAGVTVSAADETAPLRVTSGSCCDKRPWRRPPRRGARDQSR